jgi:hypothetical protein
MHHQLGCDQQWRRYQNLMNFIEQEGDDRTAAEHPSFQSREQQEWQPGEERDDDDASRAIIRIVGQVRPTQKLEERPTQDE